MRRLAVGLLVAFAVALSTARLSSPTPGWEMSAPSATIEFIDVGQGDAILIRSPEGKTALIDAGPSNGVVASLKGLGLESLDLVAVTHHHSDHYGGMREVVKQFRPKYFLATNSNHTTPMYLKLLKTVQEEGIQAVQPLPHKTRRIELGSVVLTIFPQPPPSDAEENDNSIGMRITYGDISIVMTGDSEENERAWWTKNYPDLLQDATILKLAHHGSRNGTDARWLALIDPELTVASLGAGNSYGHPHAETLSLLARTRTPLKRTDRDGSIRIITDGRRWSQSRDQVALRGKSSSPKRR